MWPLLTIGVVFTETPIYIHFAKVKPPHIATSKAMYISTTFYLSTHSREFSLIKKTFLDFG